MTLLEQRRVCVAPLRSRPLSRLLRVAPQSRGHGAVPARSIAASCALSNARRTARDASHRLLQTTRLPGTLRIDRFSRSSREERAVDAAPLAEALALSFSLFRHDPPCPRAERGSSARRSRLNSVFNRDLNPRPLGILLPEARVSAGPLNRKAPCWGAVRPAARPLTPSSRAAPSRARRALDRALPPPRQRLRPLRSLVPSLRRARSLS